MITTFILYMSLFLISFFPMVVWAYIFSYMDNNSINKKSFIVGIFWGILSVMPIFYMDKILESFDFGYLNMFYFVSSVSTIVSSLELSFSLSLFLLFLGGGAFFLWAFMHSFSGIFSIYMKNIIIFMWFCLFLGIVSYFLNYLFWSVDFVLSEGVVFWDLIFDSFKLMMFYYLLVAFMEESSKHFNFLHSSVLYMDSMKSWVLYAIFVALGFSWVENMLYLYNYYIQYSITWELLKMYFFSSIFSVIVHVLCSSMLAYYFSKALLLYSESVLSFPYMSMFMFGLVISLFLHLFFDVALTLGFSFIMFVYFIWGYLYVSSIFYSE